MPVLLIPTPTVGQDITTLVDKVDPDLWRAIYTLTRSVRESQETQTSTAARHNHIQSYLAPNQKCFCSWIDANRDVFLTLNHQELWQRATCFYKATKNSPEKLGRNLVVVLEEEEGIDAGALRGYFFE